MISLKQEIQNYTAINLKSLAENDFDIPDSIKNSIFLYNKALDSIRMDSEDIAIIELKKAIAMNPGFHEAMNLLGLCYSYTKEYAKATEIFEKVVAAENNSIKALRYLSLMNSDDHVVSALESKTRNTKKEAAQNQNGKRSFFGDLLNIRKEWKNDWNKYVTGIIAGALVVFLIMFFFYTPPAPAVDASANAQSTTGDVSGEGAATAKDGTGQDNVDNGLQSKLDTANAQVDYYKNVLKLFDTQELIRDKKYEEAADLLTLLKSAGFTENDKKRFDSMFSDVVPKAAATLINEAGKLMNSKKYQDALDKLSKVQVYGSDQTNMELVLYWMGKCYMSLNDSKNAVSSFDQLVNTYPNGKYTRFAQNRIKELSRIP